MDTAQVLSVLSLILVVIALIGILFPPGYPSDESSARRVPLQGSIERNGVLIFIERAQKQGLSEKQAIRAFAKAALLRLRNKEPTNEDVVEAIEKVRDTLKDDKKLPDALAGAARQALANGGRL